MAFFLSPVCNDQQSDVNGNPLNGGQVLTYLAGSSTPAPTFTDSMGATTQANPIILNTLGLPANPIWMTSGVPLKFIVKDANGTTLRVIDNVSGVNDAAVSQSEWVTFSSTPVFINATSFSVAGDQTQILQVNRRLKTQNTAGQIYSFITAAVFATGLTTVTVANDSGVLDPGLSMVEYGLLSATNKSIPQRIIGTVSQVGGVPTGAIIERGSNANGQYVRYADGTQICTVRVTSTTQAFALYTAPVHISNYTWTFPIAFIEAPVVNCSEFKWGTSASWGGTGAAPTTSQVTLRGYDLAANATGTATIISAAAVGRWF